MKLRLLLACLILGLTASIGYAASFVDQAQLGPTDNEAGGRLVYGSSTSSSPGSNAFSGNSGVVVSPVAAVPEPSTIALIAFGALGFGALTLRRRK